MRIVIEVEGAEISITARETGAKAASEERLPAQVTAGEALDAGTAPSSGELSGPNAVVSQQIVTTMTRAGAEDAGQAPDISAMGITPGQAMPVVLATSGDEEAIDAGAARFTPPGAETMGGV